MAKIGLIDVDGHNNKRADAWNSRAYLNAVKVIWCKDCVYKEKAKVNKKGFLICPASGLEITDNDYCS